MATLRLMNNVVVSFAHFGRQRAKMPRFDQPVPHWLFHYSFNVAMLNRSPRIRTLTVTAQLHHLRWPFDHMASLSCASSPSAYALYDVLVHQLAVLLAASFRPLLTDWPLPFASSCRLISIRILDGDLPTEDFHLIS